MAPVVTDKLENFFSAFPARVYPKGQILVFANEEPSHVFYIVSGRVRMYDISYRGDEVIVNLFQPPLFFPMAWAINRTHNRFFYSAETLVHVRAAPPDAVIQFIKDNPDVLYDLLSRVYHNMDSLSGKMLQLMAGTARTRLIYELVTEARRYGTKQSSNSYLLNISEANLAAHAGMSRETVSREFSKLARESYVRGSREGIVILDLAALTALL